MNDPRPSAGGHWLPGALLLVAACGLAVVGGLLLGLRSWSLYLGLFLASLLAAGGVERLLARRSGPASPRSRRKLRVIQGGKAYDLEGDDSTKNQRYLM